MHALLTINARQPDKGTNPEIEDGSSLFLFCKVLRKQILKQVSSQEELVDFEGRQEHRKQRRVREAQTDLPRLISAQVSPAAARKISHS